MYIGMYCLPYRPIAIFLKITSFAVFRVFHGVRSLLGFCTDRQWHAEVSSAKQTVDERVISGGDYSGGGLLRSVVLGGDLNQIRLERPMLAFGW